MIRSRAVQVIYRSVYLILMVLGILDSLGAFSGVFNDTFYVYYTNQSNYICFVVALVELIVAICALCKGKRQGNESPISQIKFLAAVWILITCLVYNILLEGDLASPDYWTLSNCILHFFGPILFILDYVLFTERQKIHAWSIPCVIIYPYLYIAFIYIRAYFLRGGYTGPIYPYFFLDPRENGYAYVFIYVLALSAVFLALAVVFWAIDWIGPRRRKEIRI